MRGLLSISFMRDTLTRTRGSCIMENAAVNSAVPIMPMYCKSCSSSPAVTAAPAVIRSPPRNRTSTVTTLSSSDAMGAVSDIVTLVLTKLSAITFVASAMRACSYGSRQNARMTRMPLSRSWTIAFCLSRNALDRLASGTTMRVTAAIITIISGTHTTTTDAIIPSIRNAITHPTTVYTGTIMTVRTAIERKSISPKTSYVERSSIAVTPILFMSATDILHACSYTAARRSAVMEVVTDDDTRTETRVNNSDATASTPIIRHVTKTSPMPADAELTALSCSTASPIRYGCIRLHAHEHRNSAVKTIILRRYGFITAA